MRQPEVTDLPVADERGLISGVLARDRKATAEFVGRCADWVYPYVVRRLIPRTEIVEDLMQEILLSAWQNLPNFRGDARLQAWILGIARHKVQDYYRKRIHEELQDDEELSPGPAELPRFDLQLDIATQRQRVQRTLVLLPEAYGLALLWRYRDEKSAREMAELTGKTEKAMERLLARARDCFRRSWNDTER
jgi:RNA polymerase sigma-70 factor (ECF subfamily)